MSTIDVEVTIGGRLHSPEQLDRLRYERDLHVLHQLKRLGARIERDGSSPTDDDIDHLTAADAHELSVATRLAHGADGLRKIYEEQRRASDRMWKEIQAASEGRPLQAARADLTVRGMTHEEFYAHVTDFSRLQSAVVQAHPEHFFFYPEEDGALAMETFGMYGVPTEVRVVADPAVPPPVPIEEGFRLLLAGRTSLAEDGTPVDIVAYHQFKPLENGMIVKLCAMFPAEAPKELVDGHSLHLAVEFRATLEMIAAAL